MKQTIAILSLWLLSACHSGQPSQVVEKNEHNTFVPKYSKRFKIDYYENGKLISILNPSDGKTLTSYFLTDSAVNVQRFPEAFFVQNPVDKIVCLSTTHIAALSLLKSEPKIQAIANNYLIYNESVREKVANNRISDIGFDYNPDIEKIIRLHPNLVFSDAETPTTANALSKLPQARIPVVVSNDYKEQSPLARAEWIYYFAAFVNQEKIADSIFQVVEKNYLDLKNRLPEKSLSVFCNQPYQGIWYMPSQESYTTQLLSDAGGNFLWKKDETTNGLNLSLNYEQVFKRAQHADIWLLFSHEKTRSELSSQDPKLKYFDAFAKQKVYSAARRSIGKVGSDYWESGCFLPHLVLNDLQIILQGKTEAEDSLYYFYRLK